MDLNLNKLPWYAQVGLFVALSAAGVFIFWNFYVSPLEIEMAGRQNQLDALRADINKGLATARQLNDFRRDVATLEAQLEGLKAVLPEQKDIAELLNGIQNLAVQSNMTIRAVKPQARVTRALHEEWPIGLELEGTYNNLGLFFDRVANSPRIINVGNVIVRVKERPDSNATITAECVATTFVLLAQPARPATPPGAAAPPAATGAH